MRHPTAIKLKCYSNTEANSNLIRIQSRFTAGGMLTQCRNQRKLQCKINENQCKLERSSFLECEPPDACKCLGGK